MVDESTNDKMSDVLNEVIQNVCFKFLEHVPEEYRNDEMRVFFEVEMAHWFYVDHFVGNPDFPQCKPIGFKEFAKLMFQCCSYLKPKMDRCQQLIDNFNNYKQHIPTNGAMLIDKSLEYVLLVQGYFASSNSWGFPKGKVNEGEKSIDCAIREVQEEIGYDISSKINRRISFSRYNNKALTQLFVVSDVEMDFDFRPHLNKEIRKIQWFQIKYLPRDRADLDNPAKIGMKPNNFYNVVPFVQDLLNFIKKEKAKRGKKEKKKIPSPVYLTHAVSSPMMIPNQAFTGESFIKHISSFEQLPHSPITSDSKPPTVLVYSAPKELLPKSGPNISPSSLLPDVIEAPYSPPSSPFGRVPRMSCDEATSAMVKLLKLKSKPKDEEETLQLKFEEQNGDDPLEGPPTGQNYSLTSKPLDRKKDESKAPDSLPKTNSAQQNFLDMLRRAKAASEQALPGRNQVNSIPDTPRTHKPRLPGSRRNAKTPVFYQ